MIIAEWKPINEIVQSIRSHKTILLIGCATCVAECAAGGEKEVETLAPLLKMAMQIDGHPIHIIAKTLERQCEWEFIEELAPIVPDCDAIVSIACGIGIQGIAERFPDLAIYPGVNTTSLAIRQELGIWAARCEACGDCVLGETFGLCPIARCAKNLLNGPCGGTRKDGTCEVDKDTDCVWGLIFERALARGKIANLEEIKKPKNWSNSRHGGPKRVIREDLIV